MIEYFKYNFSFDPGDNVTGKCQYRWICDRKRRNVFMLLFLVIVVFVVSVVAVQNTYDYFESDISEGLINVSFYLFALQILNFTIMILNTMNILNVMFKKTKCVVISTCNKRIGSRYNWDSFVDDKQLDDEDKMLAYISSIVEWMKEQQFCGNVELSFTNEYPDMLLYMENFYFRFTSEDDLIFVKLVWG